MEFGHQHRPAGSGSTDNDQSSNWNSKYTEPFVIFLAVLLSFTFVVPAVALGVLHRVTIEVAIIIAIPCPLLLIAIGIYVRWRWQAMKRARHMHDLQPMPVPYNRMRPTILHSTSPQFNTAQSAHNIVIGSGDESRTGEMGASQTAAIFHDGHDSETGLLLKNEQ